MTTTLLAEMVLERRGGVTSLVDLPPELLTSICVLVGCPTVFGCRLLCRRLRDVIDASLEVQYQIELMREGVLDGRHQTELGLTLAQGVRITPGLVRSTHAQQAPSLCLVPTPTHVRDPCLTSSDRLARLRALRKAWTTLSWTECVTVPMPGPCCAYELVGGVFCKTQPAVRRAHGPGGFGNALSGYVQGSVDHEDGHGGDSLWGEDEEEDTAHVHGARMMSLTWLPKTGGTGYTAIREDLGIPTRDFALDPSQDLMVLFKGGEDAGLPMVVVFPGVLELHIKTISTNRTHPEAGVPVLSAPVLYPVTSVFVQIVDDVVGMMYCVDPARPRITIWNWKTGQLVVDRTSGHLPTGAWDFSFVHSRALFVTTVHGHGTIELFSFVCDPVTTDADSLTHVATVHLPPVHESVRVLSVSTHTGPFLAGCPPGAAFTSSNRDRIHVLTVQYIHLLSLDGPRTRPRMGVIVHQRGLERCLEMGMARKEVTGMVLEVPWIEWGLRYARMLPHMTVFQWLRYVHGQRFVMLHPTSKTGKSTLQVLDFNVRRAFDDDGDTDIDEEMDEDEDENGDGSPLSSKPTLERVDYPTRIVMPNLFVDAVESGLPFREARRDITGDYSGIMIDDERLVGLKYPAFLTGDMKEIDVFTM